MAAPKFLAIINGWYTEVKTILTSAGAGDANKVPSTDATGRLDKTFMPGGDPIASTSGVSDAGKLIKTDATNGRIDPTMMPGGSPVNTSAGAGDAGKLPKLDAGGALAANMMPGGAPIAATAGAGDAGKLLKADANGRLDPTAAPGGTPVAASAGAGDSGKLAKLNGSGQFDPTFMPGGSPVNTSAGAGDAGKIPKLDGSGRLAQSMMPVGVADDERPVICSEALSAGNLVNLWSNAGVLNVRKADATTVGKEAQGYVNASYASGASAIVLFDGPISGLTGLTPGMRYYLDTTAGGVTLTPPSAAGNIVQYVGQSLSATELTFEPGDPVVLA